MKQIKTGVLALALSLGLAGPGAASATAADIEIGITNRTGSVLNATSSCAATWDALRENETISRTWPNAGGTCTVATIAETGVCLFAIDVVKQSIKATSTRGSVRCDGTFRSSAIVELVVM